MKIYQTLVLAVLFSILTLAVVFPANAEIDSPKKQMSKGISVEDVLCKEWLELVIRTNGNAACVKPDTADKMKKITRLI